MRPPTLCAPPVPGQSAIRKRLSLRRDSPVMLLRAPGLQYQLLIYADKNKYLTKTAITPAFTLTVREAVNRCPPTRPHNAHKR